MKISSKLMTLKGMVMIFLLAGVLVFAAGCGSGGTNAGTGGDRDPIPGSPRSLAQLRILPADSSVPAGFNRQLSAIALYSDNTIEDVTSSVTWNSSNTTAAVINTAGLASAVTPGVTTITAEIPGNLSASTSLTVTGASLVSIAVIPPNVSLPVGLSYPFIAEGHFSDGSVLNITDDVDWESLDPLVAIVNTAGEAEALLAGSTEIRAVRNALSASASLTVLDAQVASLQVFSSGERVSLAGTLSFTAEGTLTDGSVIDLTSSVIWSVSDSNIALISNNAGSRGKLQPLVNGGPIVISAVLPDSGISADSDPVFVENIALDEVAGIEVTDQGTARADYTNIQKQVIVDGAGRIHTAWLSEGEGMRYARSLDGGQSFMPSVLLLDTTMVLDDPVPGGLTLASFGNDKVYLAYIDISGQVSLIHSADGGVSWSAPLTVSDSMADQVSMTVRGSHVYIVYNRFSVSGKTYFTRSLDGGLTFESEREIYGGFTSFPFVLDDPRTGDIYVIINFLSNFIMVSTDFGASFSSPGLFIIPTRLVYPSFVIGPVSELYGSGFRNYTRPDFFLGNLNAWNFPSPAQTDISSATLGERTLAVDGSGKIFIVSKSGGDIILETSDDQGAVFTSAVVAEDAGKPFVYSNSYMEGAAILYLKDGKFHFSYVR